MQSLTQGAQDSPPAALYHGALVAATQVCGEKVKLANKVFTELHRSALR